MRAILVGATGLVGGFLLEQLLADPAFSAVRIITRKKVALTHPKLSGTVMDLVGNQSFEQEIREADVFFCCIGTTQAKVKGDKSLYRKIDFDIPVRAAKACADHGIPRFLVLSSVGANAGSSNFYLQLKGEMEDAVLQQPIETICIFRPSMILGKRSEKRTGEAIAGFIMPLLNPFLIGSLSRFKSIEATKIAAALRMAAKRTPTGTHIMHYEEIKELAAGQA